MMERRDDLIQEYATLRKEWLKIFYIEYNGDLEKFLHDEIQEELGARMRKMTLLMNKRELSYIRKKINS